MYECDGHGQYTDENRYGFCWDAMDVDPNNVDAWEYAGL